MAQPVLHKRKEIKLIQKAAFNIKKFRMKAHLTQERLADKTKLTIQRCESGKYDMTLTTLGILSKHLKIEPYQLLK